MATWTNYWRIITPKSTKEQYQTSLKTDSYDSSEHGFTATTQWYNSLLKGPGSRIQSYQQWDSMDTNADIARALDIIAEEMTNEERVNQIPFQIIFNNFLCILYFQ